MNDALDQQIAFIRELDRLKTIIRQTDLHAVDRRENTAEHSWHAATAALTLAEHAPEGTDITHAVQLLLLHDIVEIDAGDTYAYDEDGYADKDEREGRAAERIFGMLPDNQGDAFREMWEEFEARETPEAKYANAVDQILPILHNIWKEGGSWLEHRPTYDQVYERTYRRLGGSGATALWQYVQRLLAEAVKEGWLPPPQQGKNA